MIDWLVMTLVSSTLLMLGVLAVRRPVAAVFGPRLAYALWALPALRLVLPALPGWHVLFVPVAFIEPGRPFTVGIVDPATAWQHEAHRDSLSTIVVTDGPHVAAAWSPGIIEVVVALWLAGAVLWFGWQMLRYRLYVARALEDARLLTRVGGTDVFVSDAVSGPVAAGILRPLILLPGDFTLRYTPAEQRLALLHEGAHHDRGDLAANLAALAVVALHWWNPVAHLAYRAFRTDQELACDATVLAEAGADDRGAYGSAVLKSACTATPAAACALNHKMQLKQRIGMMKSRPGGPLRMAVGTATVLSLIGGGLLLTAAGMAEPPLPPAPPEPAASTRFARDMPAPPAPVAPPAAPTAPSAVAGVAPPAQPAAVTPPAPVTTTKIVTVRTGRGLYGSVTADDLLGPGIEREVEAALVDAGIEDAPGPVRVIMNHRGRSIAIASDDITAAELAHCVSRARADAGDSITVATCAPGAVSIDRVDLADTLKRARAEIAAAGQLTAEQRRRALAGIDAAIGSSGE